MPWMARTLSWGRRYPSALILSFWRQRSLKIAYFCEMLLYLKRCAKFILALSEYFFSMLWTRHSVSAGGFLEPPPKYTSYLILRRRMFSSRTFSSSSTVTRSSLAKSGGGLEYSIENEANNRQVTKEMAQADLPCVGCI